MPIARRLRGATTFSTPSGSCTWISTEWGSDVQSMVNGALNLAVRAAASSSSIGPRRLTRLRRSSTAPGSSVMSSVELLARRLQHPFAVRSGNWRNNSTV